MMDKLTAMARELAMANGAGFAVITEPEYDRTDGSLATMAEALLERFEGTGIDLLALRREGAMLVAEINEDNADEPLCPRAFDRVVHDLAWRLLGQVWEGRLNISFTPARIELTRVA